LDAGSERRILLKRFYYTDRSLFELGTVLRVPWFERFQPKFGRDAYAYFTPEEKLEAMELLCRQADDKTFVSALNRAEHPTYLDIGRFVGERYFFDGSKFSQEDKRPALREDVNAVIEETSGRVAIILRAIISLYHADRWDKAYGGAAWPDILANIREMRGSYPSPRDLTILKSYRIYFKTGSRRYPTHTVPEEMIPTIEEVLRKVPAIKIKTKATNKKV
jgi:hypothetical protein